MAAASVTDSAQHWVEARIASGDVTATPTVTGDRSDGVALTNLLIALDDLGIIVDSTVA